MNVKITALMFAIRKFGLPILLGGITGWLVHHGYDNWADVSCSVADALAVHVEECKQ